MRYSFLAIVLIMFSSSQLRAQKENSFTIRAGYLHSSTHVEIANSLLIGIALVKAKPGFYIGLAYEHLLSTLLTSQIELNFQQKGQRLGNYAGDMPINLNYNYIGLTPTIGIQPMSNLSFWVGPEVNLLVGKSSSWPHSNSIEVGLVGRVRYQFRRMGITGGYFKGLTVHDRSTTKTYAFTNRNWQVGLSYLISKL
ncbi:PorT family protein [Spirosoma fluviale]|uniref:Outer membrane protein beta-barrel domain-containing protein n=1 Tax=Spirosoma fluviale TaxID=1597977 RepID=A0A286G164_9BACT|nr:PorT family protein [Spirosoma fluviale]SOD88909.1 hypothetical protein SAMN06269250_2884 [Spirosoma fluviale]